MRKGGSKIRKMETFRKNLEIIIKMSIVSSYTSIITSYKWIKFFSQNHKGGE